MIAPFFVGMVADRFFAAQKVLGFMHLVGAGFMIFGITLMKSSEPSASTINWVAIFGHMMCFYPTLALTNTIAMKVMTNPEKEFPGIRVFGTIGWIAAGLALSWLGFDTSINMFYLTAAAGAMLGLLSFALPNTPPTATGPVSIKQIIGWDALVMLTKPNYLVFMLSSMLICIPLAFYYQITSRIVEMSGLPIGQTMSYGQMSEIFFMLVMPLFFARLGVKWMLAVGMLAWVTRYALFALGAPDEIRWMVIGGIVLHGICYDFFFVTGQIYTDQAAPKEIRAQAQGMLVLFTLGLGMFIGAQVAGKIEAMHTTDASKAQAAIVKAKGEEAAKLSEAIAKADAAAKPDLEGQLKKVNDEKTAARKAELKAIDWKPLWGKPAIFAAAVMLLFLAFFRSPGAATMPKAH